MIDKPTEEIYYNNGSIKYLKWEKNGKRHRLNGLPAHIWYNQDGTIMYQEWYENGKLLSKKEVLHRRQQWLNKVILSMDKKGMNI